MNPWLWLVVAGVFEVGMTTSLKLSEQNQSFTAAFLICAIVSFDCLSRAIKTLPLGLSYAVWTGIGAVGTVIVGVAYFGDPLSLVRVLLLTGLVGAMVGLKLVNGSKEGPPQPAQPSGSTQG